MISYRRNFAAEFYWASTLTRRVKRGFGGEVPPPRLDAYLQNLGMLMRDIRAESIRTYPKKADAEQVWGTVRNNE